MLLHERVIWETIGQNRLWSLSLKKVALIGVLLFGSESEILFFKHSSDRPTLPFQIPDEFFLNHKTESLAFPHAVPKSI
jgi:hypothetical protein